MCFGFKALLAQMESRGPYGEGPGSVFRREVARAGGRGEGFTSAQQVGKTHFQERGGCILGDGDG